MGGVVVGSEIETYEVIGGIEIKTGKRIIKYIFDNNERFLYTRIEYLVWVGTEQDGQFIASTMQEIYKKIDIEKGRYQMIKNFALIPGDPLPPPLYLNTQYVWDTAEDMNGDGIPDKVNNVETWELGDPEEGGIWGSLQKTWKEFKIVDGLERLLTSTLLFEV